MRGVMVEDVYTQPIALAIDSKPTVRTGAPRWYYTIQRYVTGRPMVVTNHGLIPLRKPGPRCDAEGDVA